MDQEKSLLQFYPFTSSVNPSFWHKLTEIKLDIDKLNQNSRKIWGWYSNLLSSTNSALFEVDSTSFNTECGENFCLPAHGLLLNRNTIEQFKDCDKNQLIKDESQFVCDIIKSGKAAKDPSLLNFFIVLSFADLKKYHYYYWFCFPAAPKINVNLLKTIPICDAIRKDLVEKLYCEYIKLALNQRTFFIVTTNNSSLEVLMLDSIKEIPENQLDDCYFVFSDPSSSLTSPSWVIRNFIAFLLTNCPMLKGRTINMLALRLNRTKNEISCDNSLIFQILDRNGEEMFDSANTWVGWEKNERGRFGPRLANMKNSIDPICLAENAVDLNLKLMKWQVLPDINLEKIKNAKCLLLGSGTLGCSVARTLLAWGVRHISFVDNGHVSFSNPVRQNLFTYDDCLENKPKVEAASANLKRIFPGVKSEGYNLCIPMPGHPVGESLLSQTENDVQTLAKLISDHDVIFLLMDSRESRWLPTLLGACFKKIVINAALGFDTYLVMRHGFRSVDLPSILESTEGLKAVPGHKLGCYFCNDVTAPGNSLKDRTLDQQCTVTRPGISAIAGALAVEIAISILQHPDGANAPAFYKINQEMSDDQDEGILGILPHSIRGFLSSYSHVLPTTEKYENCVACSETVVQEYERAGFDFLLKVFESCKFLEDLTGLSKIHNEITDLEVWDLEDTDNEDDNESN